MLCSICAEGLCEQQQPILAIPSQERQYVNGVFWGGRKQDRYLGKVKRLSGFTEENTLTEGSA